jgi:chemotaxis methyl-accepting protein methylase
MRLIKGWLRPEPARPVCTNSQLTTQCPVIRARVFSPSSTSPYTFALRAPLCILELLKSHKDLLLELQFPCVFIFYSSLVRPANMLIKKLGFSRVVGIGASAGGFDALAQLLPTLRSDGHSVYIIALHMARHNHVDLILKLLKRLSALPLIAATHNDLLVADQVFLIPTGVTGVIQQGRIQLLPVTSVQISSPSVNALFKSIAQDGRYGVGIILSGAGNDGLLGCRAIKAAKGKVIAQSLDSAQLHGMPGSIIRANLADEILAPEQIAQWLNNETHFFQEKVNSIPASATLPLSDADVFKHLLQAVLATTGIDFSHYKEETLLRRLNRRMAALNITSLLAYQIYAQKHPDELHKLQHQFLISLSSFFRDSESFAVLKQHLVELLKDKLPGNSIRIWVPACASGEECYSWTILVAEVLGSRFADYSISVIGSDLNEQAIAVAAQGCYPEPALRDMAPDILERYFDRDGQYFRVKPFIRQACQFHVEDVVSNNLLEKVDAISCRNLLIYMKSELQDKLIKKFYDCLIPGGILFLGQSETIGLIGNTLFLPLDHYHRVYRRKKLK